MKIDEIEKYFPMLPKELIEKLKMVDNMVFFMKEAKLYEYIQDLCLTNGVDSESHFLEVLADHAHEIYEKFDEITGLLEEK